MRQIQWPVIFIATALILTGCQSTPNSSASTPEPEITIEQMLISASNQLNATLPKMIDAETRLDTSYATGNRFHYKSTLINYDIEHIDVDIFNEEMSESTSNYICTSSDMEFFKSNKIILVYSYYDDKNKFISDVIVDTATCPKAQGLSLSSD